jgi:hypothetical protein
MLARKVCAAAGPISAETRPENWNEDEDERE